MNVQTLTGVLHAQELLLVSLVRSMPEDARRTLVETFRQQLEFAASSHLDAASAKETHEAFVAHARKLMIRLESLS